MRGRDGGLLPCPTVALVALTHGALIVAMVLSRHGAWTRLPAALVSLGVILFCSDLGMKAMGGAGLFAYAAPAGGLILVAGLLALALGAIASLRSR